MQELQSATEDESHFLISSLSPGRFQKLVAAGIVLGTLVALYLTTGPFADTDFGANYAFVVVHSTAMCVIDAITSVLLFAQFFALRSRSTVVIASGYLFTSLVIVEQVLAFPGVFAPHGLFGGLQTTPWLYVAWHGGFAMFVIAYAWIKDGPNSKVTRPGHPYSELAFSVAAVLMLVAVLGYVTVRFQSALPIMVIDAVRFSAAWPYRIAAPIIIPCITAVVLLAIRGRSVLDLWLAVVMLLYVIALPMSLFPKPERFTIGWYGVRLVDVLTAAMLLIVLLCETTALYAKLLDAVQGQRREREARLMTGIAVAASIAHELRQPLTAMVTMADAGMRFVDRRVPDLVKAKEAFAQIAEDGHRAGDLIESVRANFKSDTKDRVALDLDELVRATLALADSELRAHRVAVTTIPSESAIVYGNRVQLQQVLLNLIRNAVDSMAGNEDAKVLTITSKCQEDNGVTVSVADNGPGVALPDVDRLFNPLFTTKADGMGMGLSICQAIVESHGGHLWFTPNAPRGAIFHVALRVDADPPAR